nr:MAG TPA: Repressor protein CI [Caudoviricetes sp.]
MSTFYTNYVALCAKKGKSLSAVAESIGLSRTAPNGWKKGKLPNDVSLAKLSNYFGVSVEELKNGAKELSAESKGISETEAFPATFYENYIKLCNSIGKSPSAVALELKLGKPSVTRWKSGTIPRDATIQRIADYFGVSADELRNGIKKEPTANSGELVSDTKSELVSIFDNLPLDKQALLLQVAQGLAQNQADD